MSVEFGGKSVLVANGGYYDRYRMMPNLDEIAKDPNVVSNVDYFRAFEKKEVSSRVGPAISPAFYYRTSNVQLLLLAPLNQLREKLPKPLEPLRTLPGYGLVALTFYRYDVCDNDPYNEVSVAIVIKQPGEHGSHLMELIRSIRERTFNGYVLALPVTTDLARLRGVEAYQLPKWKTQIDVNVGETAVKASIEDINTGEQDIAIDMPTPTFTTQASRAYESVNTSINSIDGVWNRITVHLNPLTFSQKLFPRNITFTRSTEGQLSKLLKDLGASTILRADVVKAAQMVLHLPVPLNSKF